MMRAFENRVDTRVIDEPLYAHYLVTTGAPHPGADEVIAAQSTCWRTVTESLCQSDPAPATVVYQKHMSHHICGEMDLEWTTSLSNAFLIREPAAMLASLAKVLPEVRLADTGLTHQVELMRYLRMQGAAPPVIDSRAVLSNPSRALAALCDALDLPFDTAMLAWPAGPRDSDGVWAPHWYDAVRASTGFGPYTPYEGHLAPELRPLMAPCQTLYDELAQYKLVI